MGDRVLTGDTLLIRGTGRTDFQNGDPRAQYRSLFGKLLKLPEETLVYPAHDYKGETVSSIGEEKRCNPRLQVRSMDEYVEIMSKLKLDNPKMMDVAVPANLHLGMHQEAIDAKGWSMSAEELQRAIAAGTAPILVDLREPGERERRGVIPHSVHAPYGDTAESVGPGGLLHELAKSSGRPLVFYCAFGERSAMALEMARQAGIEGARHLKGGIAAWREAGGEIEAGDSSR
jgi:rhodanese-related sulfurtransferase